MFVNEMVYSKLCFKNPRPNQSICESVFQSILHFSHIQNSSTFMVPLYSTTVWYYMYRTIWLEIIVNSKEQRWSLTFADILWNFNPNSVYNAYTLARLKSILRESSKKHCNKSSAYGNKAEEQGNS